MKAVAIIWVLAGWLLSSIGHTQSPPPNIVFILADDVGCEPLGCYGGTSYPTPNINRLAEGGLRFRHCYSMPVCHPTRTTFLLGRYPMHIGNPAWGTFPKQLERQTIAHAMKNAGYATAVAGKWQIATLGEDLEHPHRLGFDEYCLFGWHEGPRYHDPLIYQNGKRREDTQAKYGPDCYVDFLIDFFERNRTKPFFAFYSMALCHDVTNDLVAPVPYAPGKGRYLNYAEMMASMDACVGRVVDALERLQLREKTLIVYSGDNGTAQQSIIRAEKVAGTVPEKWRYIREPVASMQNGRLIPGGKGRLTNDGTNVPLICNWPGKISPGLVVDDLVDFSDYLPTFADLGGGVIPDSVAIDGKSFAVRIMNNQPAPRTWAVAEGSGKHWVRTARWKMYNDGALFDLLADPAEEQDRSNRPPAAAELSLLQQALRSL